MRYVAIAAIAGLTACMQTGPLRSQENPGLPTLACTVSDFTTDTGDARFVRNNRLKTYEIISTAQGFTVNVTSAEFRNFSEDYVVTTVDATRIGGVRDDSMRGSVDTTLVVQRNVTNGQRVAIKTVTVQTEIEGRDATQNRWVLACIDAGQRG